MSAAVRIAPGRRASVRLAPIMLAALVAAGCASTPEATPATPGQVENLMPRSGGDARVLAAAKAQELEQLRLVATNLVAALVQLPETRPAEATLQVNRPVTAFGHVIVRSLEDAGYALIQVSNDLGPDYTNYARRVAETATGTVTDYTLTVGTVELSREFEVKDGRIFPASLLRVRGSDSVAEIALADQIFAEQGGAGTQFVSGALDVEGDGMGEVNTVEVSDFDVRELTNRTSSRDAIDRARAGVRSATAVTTAPDLDDFDEQRRTVLIFDDPRELRLGAGNKAAIRNLARLHRRGDVVMIRGCADVDGANERAAERSAVVESELASHDLPSASTWIAPCVRTSYRHPNDNSPVPVELLLLRPS